jgi:hypothetical protein
LHHKKKISKIFISELKLNLSKTASFWFYILADFIERRHGDKTIFWILSGFIAHKHFIFTQKYYILKKIIFFLIFNPAIESQYYCDTKIKIVSQTA